MKTTIQRRQGKSSIEIIEEATHLLRMAAPGTLLCYFLGTIPFVLGLLYFWADMSRSATAYDHLVEGSLALALLFIWMKWWQALFARRLSLQIGGRDFSAPSIADSIKLAVQQTALMPWGLVVLPIAFLITLPFGWCFAFFQNMTVLGLGPEEGRKEPVRAAWRQAALWPGQNHVLILVLFLFALFVFLNITSALFLLPRLVKTLLGVETMFTRSNLHLFNSTFWCAVLAFTHLCVDPLVKAAYVVRCHYGVSLATGEDLRIDLRTSRRKMLSMLPVVLLFLGMLLHIVPARAEVPAVPAPVSGSKRLPPEQIDEAVERVMTGPEFSWRAPRERQIEKDRAEDGFLFRILETIGGWIKKFFEWVGDFFEWLWKLMPKATPHEKDRLSQGWSGIGGLYIFAYVLLALLLSAAAILFWRRMRQRRKVEETALAPPSAMAVPDVADENVTAEAFSGESWASLAKELFARGEARLGLRALFFASLNTLARRDLLTLAKYKSNREYERELLRRAHSLGDLVSSFSGNVLILERVWYGMYPAEEETVAAFWENFRRIEAAVERS